MARHKSQKKKRALVSAKKKNRRTPVWVVLRTQDRSKIRKPTRSWRERKIGGKIARKLKRENWKMRVMITGTKFRKRSTKKRD